jgi:glycosyltransferase involved in cell wall biosynthesis
VKKTICIVTASDMTVRAFMLDHIRELSRHYTVYVVTNSENFSLSDEYGINAINITIPIVRAIRPLKDLRALFMLWGFFRKQHFDLVHSITPKSGLLTGLAGIFAGVQHRVHIFTGQVWVTTKGFYRLLLKTMDRVIALCANNILVDSISQRDFLVAEKVVNAERVLVLGNGSISGVNLSRFYPRSDERSRIRSEQGIAEDATVFLFLGRLNRDKGVLDLAWAFNLLAAKYHNSYLLFVGADEGGMEDRVKKICSKCAEKVRFVSFTKEPEFYMNAADVFCLPSYREGFGSVVIEAGASEVPSVGTRIYGITDSIDEGKTGLLFAPGGIDKLYCHMARFIDNPEMRKEMGEAARVRAEKMFPSTLITSELVKHYQKSLAG